MNTSRIPEYSTPSFDGMLLWFATMSERGLLLHPDDPAEEIYDIATGTRTFSPDEATEVNKTIRTMFELYGDQVYEAAYPVFMKRMGLRLDA
ncbi:hypothetical protein FEF65_04905 [Mariprofundus erugo]|uniref:Uncharacterized protein n=1 Tax=Mariprofundus erugo TaxID=2528639 RepID=A0A5R9GPY7_9PROT|nr:hypothetical protein [Mariprofundus erugo]TLS68331.1 hypothetical protein FEF65_04905 [Mariprofundus erugo]